MVSRFAGPEAACIEVAGVESVAVDPVEVTDKEPGGGLAATVQEEEEGGGPDAGLGAGWSVFLAVANVARFLARASLFSTCFSEGVPPEATSLSTGGAWRAGWMEEAAGGLSAAALVLLHPQHHWCSTRLRRPAVAAGQSAHKQRQPLEAFGGRLARIPPSASIMPLNSWNSLYCCANDVPAPHREPIVGGTKTKTYDANVRSSGGSTSTPQDNAKRRRATNERKRGYCGSAKAAPPQVRVSVSRPKQHRLRYGPRATKSRHPAPPTAEGNWGLSKMFT